MFDDIFLIQKCIIKDSCCDTKEREKLLISVAIVTATSYHSEARKSVNRSNQLLQGRRPSYYREHNHLFPEGLGKGAHVNITPTFRQLC